MTDQLIAELDAYEGHAYAVTFSPDGHRLLVGGFGGLIRVYDTTSWQEVVQYAHHDKSTNHIAFAPDGDTFAVSSSDRTITIWKSNTDEPTAILKGHRNTVMGLSWSPDGKRLVSGATDNTIRIWNLQDTDEKPAILKSPYRIVSHVDFINDGAQILSAGGGDEALVWDAESGEIVATMPGHGKSARHMQLSSDGKALLTQDFEAWFASGKPKTGPCPPRMTSAQRRRDPSNSHRTGPASRSWKRNVSASSPYPLWISKRSSRYQSRAST